MIILSHNYWNISK